MKLEGSWTIALLTGVLYLASSLRAQLVDRAPPRVPLGNVVMVVDDATGAPIRHYRLFDGPQFTPGGPAEFGQGLRFTVDSPDGSYVRRAGYSKPLVGLAVRVIADGYLAADSQVFGTDQWKPYVLRLKAAKPVTGIVLDSDDLPVADVQVAWVSSERQAVVDARARMSEQYLISPEVIARTGADGYFELPPGLPAGAVVAIHPKGYSQLDTRQFISGEKIKLTRWARLQGKVTRAKAGAGNVTVWASALDEQVRSRNSPIHWMLRTDLLADGSFSFDYVPPIPAAVGLEARIGLASRVLVEPKQGGTVTVTIGGDGRDVTATMRFPAEVGTDRIPTAYAAGALQTVITLRPTSDPTNDPTVVYREQPDPRRLFYSGESIDGRAMIIRDVPAGEYVMYLDVLSAPRRGERAASIARASHPVKLAKGGGAVDVGEITLARVNGASTQSHQGR
jgi:hypothetical protein